jgi:hypothetical protein
VWSGGYWPAFRRSLLPPLSRWWGKVLWKVGQHLPDYAVQHPKRHLNTHHLRIWNLIKFWSGLWTWDAALGGVVVSVLATGPKVRGFKSGRGRWILRVIKSVARLSSEGK